MSKSILQICYGMSAAGSLRHAGYDSVMMFTHDFDGPLHDFKTYEEYESRSHSLHEEMAEKYGTYGQYEQMFFMLDKTKPALLSVDSGQQIPLMSEDFVDIIKEQDEIHFWLSKGFHEHILLSLIIRLFDLYSIDLQKIRIKTVTEAYDYHKVKYEVYHIGRVSPNTFAAIQTAYPLSSSQLSYFRDAWFALTAPTPHLLINLSHRSNEFHFLEGLKEFMDRLPDSKSGLNACEREILRALHDTDQHSTKIGKIMGPIMGREGYVFKDDSYIYTCVKRLSDQHAKKPALVIGPLLGGVDAMYLECITFTDFGKALSTGEANWLDENDIDYDVGGMHLSSKDNQIYFSNHILEKM